MIRQPDILAEYTQTPVVFLHGINDHCEGLQGFVDMVDGMMNNTAYMKCIEIGTGAISSIFVDVRSQAKVACL